MFQSRPADWKEADVGCDMTRWHPLDALRVRPLDNSNRMAVSLAAEESMGSKWEWGYGVFDGETPIGAFASVPTISWWMDETVKKWQSLTAFSVMENIMATQGHRQYLVLCHEDSNYFPLMGRLFDPSPMSVTGSPVDLFSRRLS